MKCQLLPKEVTTPIAQIFLFYSHSRWLPSVPEENVIVITNGKEELNGQVIITSYSLLTRTYEKYLRIQPEVAILDESHLIKTGNAVNISFIIFARNVKANFSFREQLKTYKYGLHLTAILKKKMYNKNFRIYMKF